MKPDNVEKLEKHRPKLNLWINDKTCHLDSGEKAEILNVIREEFNSGYHVDLWCHACVVRMLEHAFNEMDKRKIDTITIPLGANDVKITDLNIRPDTNYTINTKD